MPNAITRARVLHALPLSGLLILAACTGGQPLPSVGPTPTPVSSASPSGAPSSGPTQRPTAAPTATPGQVGQIDHPTEPTAVVLRMLVTGGLIFLEYHLTETPVFTLYGDGTVLFRPSPTDGGLGGPGTADPALVKATMNPEQVDALLRFSLTQGGLLDARDAYLEVGVADAPDTVFTIHAAGVDKDVRVAALGFDAQSPDPADRARFEVLGDLLDSFETEVAAGNVDSTESWHPSAYRAFLTESFGGDGEVIDWPWDDIAVDDFTMEETGFAREATLTPQQVAQVVSEPTGRITGLIVRSAQVRFQLSLRPLLPDQVAASEE